MNRLCGLGWVFFPTPFSVHHGSSALVSAGHSPRGDSVEGGVQKAGSACPPPSFVCFFYDSILCSSVTFSLFVVANGCSPRRR